MFSSRTDKTLQEVFGKMLVTKPLRKNESCLPSPDELRYRILLKCKSLLSSTLDTISGRKKSNESTSSEENESDNDTVNLKDTVKTGKIYLRNSCKEWEPFFFALTVDRLIYTEIEGRRDSDVDRSDVCMQKRYQFPK